MTDSGLTERTLALVLTLHNLDSFAEVRDNFYLSNYECYHGIPSPFYYLAYIFATGASERQR